MPENRRLIHHCAFPGRLKCAHSTDRTQRAGRFAERLQGCRAVLGSWVGLLVPPPKETGCECNRCPCQGLPEGREMEITALSAGMCGVGVGRASGGKSEEGWRALWELVCSPGRRSRWGQQVLGIYSCPTEGLRGRTHETHKKN